MEFLNTVMVRVYSDLGNIGYYSVIHGDGCTTFLPIIEKRKLRETPQFMNPDMIIDHCTGWRLSKYYAYAKQKADAVHNDPRIDLGFYTEEFRRGRITKNIRRKDIVLFMTGLAKYPEDIWIVKRRSLHGLIRDLKKRGLIGIYLVGGIFVEETFIIRGDAWNEYIEKYPRLMYSPHYYRYRVEDREAFAVIGKGFFINPPLKIATLTPSGFRVTRKLVELIGRKHSMNLARQRFRKSGLIKIARKKFEEILSPSIDKLL